MISHPELAVASTKIQPIMHKNDTLLTTHPLIILT
jgi:hypothetical protein